jgi:hypothetical protein
MSHIYITLSEIVDSGKREAKKVVIEEPVKLEDLGQKSKSDKKDKIEKGEKSADAKIGKSDNKSFTGKMFRRKAG